MISISGARALAMTTLAVPMGWWLAADSETTIAHYRSLTHDELLKELASNNETSVAVGIAATLFIVLAITVAMDLLTRFYSAIWARIGGPETPGPFSGSGPETGRPASTPPA